MKEKEEKESLAMYCFIPTLSVCENSNCIFSMCAVYKYNFLGASGVTDVHYKHVVITCNNRYKRSLQIHIPHQSGRVMEPYSH